MTTSSWVEFFLACVGSGAVGFFVLWISFAVMGRWIEGRFLWDWPLDLWADFAGRPRR